MTEQELVEMVASNIEPVGCSVEKHMEFLHIAEEMLSVVKARYDLVPKVRIIRHQISEAELKDMQERKSNG